MLGSVTVLVSDYDDAIAFYVDALGFALLEDTDLGGGKRWVRVAPVGVPDQPATALLLARADGADQAAAVGNQSGGRVGFFLHTSDFDEDHARMLDNGVVFVDGPREQSYGTVAVFEDLYGNRWDLIGPPLP